MLLNEFTLVQKLFLNVLDSMIVLIQNITGSHTCISFTKPGIEDIYQLDKFENGCGK